MTTFTQDTHVRQPERPCAYCGRPTAGREGKIYCSNRCRAAASREKRAAELTELRAMIRELARRAMVG